MTIKLLIADDHKIILDGLVMLLSLEPTFEIVGTAHNGTEVIAKVDELDELDVLIMDINMPEMDGIEVTRALKKKYPEIRILILSMYNRSEFVKTLISIGVDGYILKHSGKVILYQAINQLYLGERFFSEQILDNLIETPIETNEVIDIARVELSDREKEVVKLIAQEKSTAEIAEALFLSPHTINSHRKSILNKLAVKNSAGIFRYALQTGIVKGFDM